MDTHNSMAESPGNYDVQKKTPNGYIKYTSIYTVLLKWQNYRNGDYISSFQGLRKGGN